MSVFSSALLLLIFMTIMHISNNSPLFGQSESMSEEMAADEAGGEGGGIGKTYFIHYRMDRYIFIGNHYRPFGVQN